MFQFIDTYLRKKAHKKALDAFYAEAKANLESYYVMFQINRLRFFTLTAWDKVKAQSWPPPVVEYIRRLTLYNKVLQDYKDYEYWYNEDLENKNQANGRILHQKKELVEEQFKGLEDVIKPAVAVIGELC